MFILRCRDTILNNSITYFHFLFGRCVLLSMLWCMWMSEGSSQGRRLSSSVDSGDAAWSVRHAQQALLSAELSCWPPTLVFKSSSVLWYFGCWSQETEIYASFFYFLSPIWSVCT